MDTLDERAVRRRIERFPVEGTIEEKRAAFAALADLPPGERGPPPRRERLHGLDTLSFAGAEGDDAAGATGRVPLVHLHGGGYVFGSPDTHRRLARVLAASSGTTVHLPAYPLAPEHPWPAQREAMIDWLERLDAPDGLLLSGDSAGGHLALSLALDAPQALRERLRGLVLFSPNTLRDHERSATRHAHADTDAMNDPDGDADLARIAFGKLRADDPEQNPAARDLGSLPPLHVDVGGAEVLLDDSLQLARRAALDGVAVDLHVEPGAFHLRQLFAGHWPEADASLERAGRWVRRRLRGA